MKKIASSLLTLLFGLTAWAATGNDPAPVYDVKTPVDVTGVISGVRDVSKGALQGVYLTVKTKGEAMDVYLAPSAFIKIFDVQFKIGAEVNVTGSQVKFEGRDVVLARQVKLGETVLVLRDAQGMPQWLWMLKHDLPTGL